MEWLEKTKIGDLFRVTVSLVLVCLASTAVAQDEEHYEVQGAKLGRKIARQIVSSSYDRYGASIGLQTAYGLELHKSRGPVSFVGAMDGMVMGSMARSYKYQNYYHGETDFNYRKPKNMSTDISKVEISNITYADDDGDGRISKDETAQIYFDLINTGDTPVYGLIPVLMADKTKHLSISRPVPIDTLKEQSALRYVIELSGDGKRDVGKVCLMLRIRYGDNQHTDVEQIVVGNKRRE